MVIQRKNVKNENWINRGIILHRAEAIIPIGKKKWAFRFDGRFSENEKGCFIFIGNRQKDGYPILSYCNRPTRANRLSWMLIHGDIPEGKCVCHTCDDTTCINPDHLFLGTSQENTKDRDMKNRQARGINHPFCKLSKDIVKSMREEHTRNGASIRKLAAKYNVCFATAREAIIGKNWGWI